jgi:excisionase family DNA binding protein
VEPFGFNKVPEVIRQIFEKLERVEALLQDLHRQPEEETLLTLNEAAEFLKTSPGALYTKVSRGEIPFSKPGKRLYFDKDELRRWVKLGRK